MFTGFYAWLGFDYHEATPGNDHGNNWRVEMTYVRVLITAALLLAQPVCWATLGGDPASIEADRTHLNGESVVQAAAAKLPQGIQVVAMQVGAVTIKEFLNADKIVFAISWRGLTHPDLAPLLGELYSEYAAKMNATPTGRKYLRQPIKTSKITVSTGGHMRDLRGTAYLNGKLPAGVKVEDLL